MRVVMSQSDEPIVVIGGTGVLGRHVVQSLVAVGRRVRIVTRHPAVSAPAGASWAEADLLTRAGLDMAIDGAAAVVNCATGYRASRDVQATRNLIAAAWRRGRPRLVVPSIVGIDQIPLGYYRGKVEVERLLERSNLEFSIQRATQFHELVRSIFARMLPLPVMPVPDIDVQPIDARVVADRLAELAVGPHVERAPDVGGPYVQTMRELALEFLDAVGKHRPVWPIRPPGAVFRGYRSGANLTANAATATRTFAQALAMVDDSKRSRYGAGA